MTLLCMYEEIMILFQFNNLTHLELSIFKRTYSTRAATHIKCVRDISNQYRWIPFAERI